MTLEIGIAVSPAMPWMVDYVVGAERLGATSVWVPEFWAHDALTPLGALAQATDTIRLGTAIVQLGTRTPAMLAMSAMTLQELSGGRFVLGIGTSGPQVMEGWHGVHFAQPVTRTRETIEILRRITAGERLDYQGEHYRLPLPDGEGKALRSAASPVHVPVYVASLGPANLRLTGALADGWICNSFFCATAEVFTDAIAAGAEANGRSLSDVELTVSVSCEFTDDVEAAGRRHAEGYAFTFGAMGSSATNFYNRAFERQGFGSAVAEVQRLWRSGDRDAARRAVPTEIGLRTNLIGSDDEVRRRLRQYRDVGVATLRVNPMGNGLHAHLDSLGRLLDLVADVNTEPRETT
ncbi:MAG: LLM class flavin-dependent oxidoreductase [Acidimicrobiales bacterium]